MKAFGFILPLLLILGVSTPVRSESNTSMINAPCAEIVRTAFEMVDTQCQQVGRNKVCYGHSLLNAQAQAHVAGFQFEAEGDVADVVDIRTLQASSMDLESQNWGIALMQIQGETASQEDFTLLLFGDVQIENEVVVGSTLDVTIAADSRVNVRLEPKPDATVIGKLEPGDVVSANGRNTDGSWLRVSLPDDGSGWVYAPLVSSTEDVNSLEIVQDATAGFGPMRAIKLRTGMNDALCAEAPDSGVLVQTPEGMAQVSLLINGVRVELGSTVYFQAEPGGEMVVQVVEGHAIVTVDGEETLIPAGFEAAMPMDADLNVTGPAASAEPYGVERLMSLPIDLMPRAVEIHAPGTPEDMEAAIEALKPPVVIPPTSVPTPLPTAEVAPADVPAEETTTQEEMITICHKGNTITIPISAWPAHEAHGDTMGACPA
ncbi:MAG TPA: SH3 domain-containing protein [Aggregatilineaceae bacterium]|nr:SH3 domain-containing protein [Aggregatilineaceae bacterium]